MPELADLRALFYMDDHDPWYRPRSRRGGPQNEFGRGRTR